jgi:uncharacterized RDD family membrane protein YckC
MMTLEYASPSQRILAFALDYLVIFAYIVVAAPRQPEAR